MPKTTYIRCPRCDSRLRFHAEKVGKPVKCPGCKKIFEHPDAPAGTKKEPRAPGKAPASRTGRELVACPDCGSKLRFHSERIGDDVRCPACRRVFEHPETPWRDATPTDESGSISEIMEVINQDLLEPLLDEVEQHAGKAQGEPEFEPQDEDQEPPDEDVPPAPSSLTARGVVVLLLYLAAYAGGAAAWALDQGLAISLAVSVPLLFCALIVNVLALMAVPQAGWDGCRAPGGTRLLRVSLWLFVILPVVSLISFMVTKVIRG